MKCTVKGKNATHLDQITLRGNTIRSYHLPDNLNLDTLLVDDTPVQNAPKAGFGGGRGRGRGRGGRGRGRGGRR